MGNVVSSEKKDLARPSKRITILSDAIGLNNQI